MVGKVESKQQCKGSPVRYITASRDQEPSVWWPCLVLAFLCSCVLTEGKREATGQSPGRRLLSLQSKQELLGWMLGRVEMDPHTSESG